MKIGIKYNNVQTLRRGHSFREVLETTLTKLGTEGIMDNGVDKLSVSIIRIHF